MPSSVFECPTPKCGYVIASEGMNAIQLKALRMWAKTCPQCHQIGHWTEKLPLLDTETIKTQPNGGANVSTKEARDATRNKNSRQKRAANRGAGLH